MRVELYIKNIKNEILKVNGNIPSVKLSNLAEDRSTDIIVEVTKFFKKLVHLDENWVNFRLCRVVYYMGEYTAIYECEIPYDTLINGEWHVQ